MTVEIVMPFWGDVSLFKAAVSSILDQSDPDWKLIIIDDAYPSTDPEAWVTSLNDSRIQYVRNDKNVGVTANFQKSVDLATQDRLTIMGCDDRLRPDYVARIRELSQRFDADIIQPGVVVIDDEGLECIPLADRVKSFIRPRHRGPVEIKPEALATSLSHGDWMYFPSLSWKTSRIRQFGFQPQFEVVLDLALAFDLIRSGGSLVLDDEVVFEYRRHSSSVSSWKAVDGSRFDEERAFLAQSAQSFAALGWNRAARAARWRWTSRLNAVVSIPKAIGQKDRRALTTLFRHSFGK